MGDAEIVIHTKQVCERKLLELIQRAARAGCRGADVEFCFAIGSPAELVRGRVDVPSVCGLLLSTCLFCTVASAFRVIM